MHELGIVLGILKICREAAPGPGRISRVRVAIGELAAVEPELLQSAWEAAVAGTADEAAALDIRFCPARQHCSSCGEIRERVPGSWLKLCPSCGMPLAIEGGDELDVLELEYIEEEEHHV